MFGWFKRKSCVHDYEIITRGEEDITYRQYQSDIVKYFHVTTATCVHCGKRQEMDREQVATKVTDGKLLKVHKDPKHNYDWFKKEEALNELRTIK